MEENVEELHRRIAELQKEVAYLNQQLKQDNQFGLHWIDVPEAFDAESENKIPVLEEVPELAIKNDDGKPTHILIEGDNYHALTCLNYTHHGKVDVIYIDPPYNTGNGEFMYKDERYLEEYPDGNIIPKNHPLRHSAWLSFMEKRLKIAYELLSDRGVVFISIDDNEQANLKLLCDKLFFPNNFLAQIIWERAYAPIGLKKHFSESHDYIIAYAKQIEKSNNNGLPRTEEANGRYSNPDNDPRGDWKSSDLSVGPAVKSIIYPIITPSGREVLPPSGYSWRLDKESFKRYVSEDRIWFGLTGNNVPSIKRFLSEVKQGITPMTIWKYADVGHSQDATKELKEIFGGKALFTYPKPVRLLKRIIHLYSKPDSIILDFFAGSGTTLHATMQLNAEDGGHRQCILCQINEGDICRDVTYERNRRVIQGYTDSKGKSVSGLGNSLKYYRTAFVGKNGPKTATDEDKLTLAKKAGCLLSLAENTLYETSVNDYYQFFTDGQGHCTCIYFQEDYSRFEEFHQKVVALECEQKTVYVFCWADGAEFASEFEFERNVEVKSIPQPILNIYKSLNA